jgi:hypothetical protein
MCLRDIVLPLIQNGQKVSRNYFNFVGIKILTNGHHHSLPLSYVFLFFLPELFSELDRLCSPYFPTILKKYDQVIVDLMCPDIAARRICKRVWRGKVLLSH